MGAKVVLMAASLDEIVPMSCNLGLGGFGKSQLVREAGVVGGEMAKNADGNPVK